MRPILKLVSVALTHLKFVANDSATSRIWWCTSERTPEVAPLNAAFAPGASPRAATCKNTCDDTRKPSLTSASSQAATFDSTECSSSFSIPSRTTELKSSPKRGCSRAIRCRTSAMRTGSPTSPPWETNSKNTRAYQTSSSWSSRIQTPQWVAH